MKLLSVAVPCYNSAQYMCRAIETLLVGGNNIEIIIVNDGSTDDTLKIAEEYKSIYPTIVKVINQENKGHGGAVNTGLDNATGLYFRVLDSDDWLREESLVTLLKTIDKMYKNDKMVDLILTNFVYEKLGKKKKKIMTYNNVLKPRQIIRWEQVGKFKQGQYILMHSSTYRTELLRKVNLRLPENTFYVDNLFVFEPLREVETLYYIDTNLYRYFIGREDQSVNEDVMCSRIDQQIKVNKIMIDKFDCQNETNKIRKNYMTLYLTTICMVTSVLLNKIGTDEAIEKKNELWNYFKDNNPYAYRKVGKTLLGRLLSSNSKIGKKVTLIGYNIARAIYGFN